MGKDKKTSAKDKKVEKVMKEFENGTLKSSNGEVVTERKQAIAIAMSEAGIEPKTSKADISQVLQKAINHEVFWDEFSKAHQEGDIHPNGKWVWSSSANKGRGDWRTAKKPMSTSQTDKIDNEFFNISDKVKKEIYKEFDNLLDGVDLSDVDKDDLLSTFTDSAIELLKEEYHNAEDKAAKKGNRDFNQLNKERTKSINEIIRDYIKNKFKILDKKKTVAKQSVSTSKKDKEEKTWRSFIPHEERQRIPDHLQKLSKDELVSRKAETIKIRDNQMIAPTRRNSAKEEIWKIDTLISAHNKKEISDIESQISSYEYMIEEDKKLRKETKPGSPDSKRILEAIDGYESTIERLEKKLKKLK